MLPVAVLSGGLARRLLPATGTVPKALLSVAGRPFVHWQLALLAQQGITQAVLCVGHLGEQIRTAVGDGTGFGLTVRYSCDGETLLGTGGALKQALPLLGTAFFVLYGDSYLPCSFAHVQSAYEASGAPALMTVFRNENRWDTSNVLFRDGTIVEYNKRSPRPDMAHVDFGLGALSAQALAEYPPGAAFDLGDVYHGLARRGALAGLEVRERFYEIGSAAGLAAAEHYLTQQGRA
jgi:MurNAc alpha-1-phosphate uridylyltransferase